MMHKFSQWAPENADAGTLRELLARPYVWDQQRTDSASQPLAINADFSGSYLSIFKDAEAFGFIIYMPKRNGLYEIHLGFDKGITVFKVVRCIRDSLGAMFARTDAIMLVAPCPDWNLSLRRLAGSLKKSILKGDPVVTESYRISFFGRRDGRSYGGTVVPLSRMEWVRAIAKERSKAVCR